MNWLFNHRLKAFALSYFPYLGLEFGTKQSKKKLGEKQDHFVMGNSNYLRNLSIICKKRVILGLAGLPSTIRTCETYKMGLKPEL